MFKKNKLHRAISILAVAGIIAPPFVSAQQLEEVVVTAQKRVEGLGDVPLSIQVVSGETLDRGNIFAFKDLVERLPNVNMGNSPSTLSISIRGVGTGTVNGAAEQSVGMYVDGIYVSSGLQFNSPFLDVERVEVLKGPQGVLQGKNSIAGAVVVTTRKPGEETEGYLRGSYELENEGYNIEGAASMALTDNIFVRAVAQYNLEGGWLDTNSRLAADGVTELRGENDQNENDFSVFRLSTLWAPTDELELFLKLETGNAKRDGVGFGGYAIQPSATTPDGTPIIDDFLARDPNYGFITDGVVSNGFRNDYNEEANLFEAGNGSLHHEIDSDSATFTFDWDVGELGTITGVSGYSTFEEEKYLAQSMAPMDWFNSLSDSGNGGVEFDQFTQEIRLVSPGGATLDYIVGAFYMDRTNKIDGGRNIFNFSNGGLGQPAFADFHSWRNFKEDTEAWSLFAQVTWNINHALRLNLGARYTDETKDVNHDTGVDFLVDIPPLNQLVLNGFGIVPFTTADLPRKKVDDTNLDPSVSLQWDVTDEIMLYGSYTEATKAGGFNSGAARPEDTSFDPETANGFEVGMKGSFMDGRVSANVAIFYTEFDDLQVSAIDTNTNSYFFKNAAEATTQGIEADLRFMVTEELELGGALAYTDATYDDFPGAPCSLGSSRESDCDPDTNTRNAKGDEFQFSPEYSGALYADYRWSLGNGMELGFRGDVIYSDDYFIASQNDPYLTQDSFAKLDLLASLTSASGNWVLSIVGKNVTDKTTVSLGGPTPLRDGAYWSNVDAPRLVYMKAEYNF